MVKSANYPISLDIIIKGVFLTDYHNKQLLAFSTVKVEFVIIVKYNIHYGSFS